MPEPVEVAIESALLTMAQAFAAAQSLTISLPNIDFTPPPAKTESAGFVVYGKWLRATFLPADSFALGISFSAHNQHYGLLQIDVFFGQGAGEYAPARLASAAIQYFARGTRLFLDGFEVKVLQTPTRGPLQKDDPWVIVPVRIPYTCYARPAAA